MGVDYHIVVFLKVILMNSQSVNIELNTYSGHLDLLCDNPVCDEPLLLFENHSFTKDKYKTQYDELLVCHEMSYKDIFLIVKLERMYDSNHQYVDYPFL